MIWHLRDTHVLALPCHLDGRPLADSISCHRDIPCPVWPTWLAFVKNGDWKRQARLPIYCLDKEIQAVYFPVSSGTGSAFEHGVIERSCQRLLGTIRTYPDAVRPWGLPYRKFAIPYGELTYGEYLDFYLGARPEVDLVGRHERRRYFAYVDVETTGLYPEQGDEMIEIAVACVEINADGSIGDIVDEYSGFREPVKRPDPEATAVNGITWDMIEGTKFDDSRVRDMIRGAEFLAAHNYKFDRGFLAQRYPEALYKPWRCTKDGINWRKRGFQSRKLQDLLAGHNIDPGQAHRAMDDVKAAVTLLRQPGIFEEWVGS